MRTIFWLAVFAFVLTAVGSVWYILRKVKQRRAAEEERLAAFLAATAGKPGMVDAAPMPATMLPAAPVAGDGLAQQKFLFEAAHKAGEAGEPALALQLYERLLARYPQSAFAEQARKAADAQKRKLAKA
ncbi:MAG: hypothetical protein WAO95_02275 [Burkholderiales bacterium]